MALGAAEGLSLNCDHQLHLNDESPVDATSSSIPAGTNRNSSVSPDRQSSGSTGSAGSSSGRSSRGSSRGSSKGSRGSKGSSTGTGQQQRGIAVMKRGLKQTTRSALVAFPLLQGQEVIVRCDGHWCDGIVARRPNKKGDLVVVDTETWMQHTLTIKDVALKATYARALRKDPEAAASAMAKAAAHRAARALRASAPPKTFTTSTCTRAASATAPAPANPTTTAAAAAAAATAAPPQVAVTATPNQLPERAAAGAAAAAAAVVPAKTTTTTTTTPTTLGTSHSAAEDLKAGLVSNSSSSSSTDTGASSSCNSGSSTTEDVADMVVDDEATRTSAASLTSQQPEDNNQELLSLLAAAAASASSRSAPDEHRPHRPCLLPPLSEASSGWKAACRPEEAGMDPKPLLKVDAGLKEKLADGSLPGFVNIVWRNGALAHIECQGYADVERQVPMGVDTIVKLYSMTKCIISVAFAICLEENLLALDDPLPKYLPCFENMLVKAEDSATVEPAEKPITLLHLLTHTSGLGYGPMLGDEADGEGEARFIPLIERAGFGRTDSAKPSAIRTLEEWCNELSKVPLLFQPGSDWLYSYSHDVLGRVIEVVTQQRLDDFLQTRVLGPLGMADTGFKIPKEKWHRCAGVYRRQELQQEEGEEEAAVAPSPMLSPSPSPSPAPSPMPSPAPSKSLGLQHVDEAMLPSPPPSPPLPAAASSAATAAAAAAAAAASTSEPGSPQNSAAVASSSSRCSRYSLQRLDDPRVEDNEWIGDNVSPILAGGGSVDAMTGGLVSTAADYARFCLMLLRKGELDGVRLLKPETVELLTQNQLVRATGSKDVWAFGTPGVGFGLLGSVSVDHPDLDSALRPGEYGWGGMAGTAWTNDPAEDFFLLSFSLVAFDLTTEEELRMGVRESISTYHPKETPKSSGRKRIRAKTSGDQSLEPSAKLLRGSSDQGGQSCESNEDTSKKNGTEETEEGEHEKKEEDTDTTSKA